MVDDTGHVDEERFETAERAAGLDRSTEGSARRRPRPWLPIILLAPLVVFGITGTLFAPHDPSAIDPANGLLPPIWMEEGSSEYLLGTDATGRDVLSRLIDGARGTLIISLVGVAAAGIIGSAAGLVAGMRAGWFDEALMRLVDMQLSIPAVLLAILLAAALGGGILVVIVTVAVAFWSTYARVVRGETLSLKSRGFVDLAEVGGARRSYIIRRHIVPNLAQTVVVLATLLLGAAVGLEAALSFLGLGVQPPDSAWGLMVAEGRLQLTTAWWLSVWPGILIAMTVLGANLMGDWLRDRLDPKQRGL